MDSSSTISTTREEFNTFHLYNRALFSRLVITLRRDIRQSYQVMSFLLYLETIAPFLRNLIADFASLPDAVVNMVADEVVTCMRCLSFDDFPAFVTHLRRSILSPEIPYITGVTRGYLTLIFVHNNRENIFFEMKKHLTRVCVRAFEDIWVRAEMYNREIENREKAMAEMSQLGFSSAVQNGGSRTRRFSSRRANADNRTIFLTFSRGYPIAKAEVYAYFTRRFGGIVEAIRMGGAEVNEQTLYATMELSSASRVPDILIEGVYMTKYIINGKHAWARKFIPSRKSSSKHRSRHSYGNFF
ncbi:BnaA10g29910D [Brassica napus]|uniref:BnaA10g29910D protein n=1 Tax=Brassica napus TaxID=3708 RepID=A0A078JQ90_BRANA|nr:BnaA10g29910D [Brassica napus]